MKKKFLIFSLVIFIIDILYRFLLEKIFVNLSGAILVLFYLVSILLPTLLIISLSMFFYFFLENHMKSIFLRKTLSVFIGIISTVLLSSLGFILLGYTPNPLNHLIWIISPLGKFEGWSFDYLGVSFVDKIIGAIYWIFVRTYGYVSIVAFWFLTDLFSKRKSVQDNILNNSEDTRETVIQFDGKFCSNCGKEIEGKPAFCPHCGYQLSSTETTYINRTINSSDAKSSGFNALSFFFPVIGLILYLVWKDQYPVKSKGIGKWAIIGAVTGFVFGIIYYLSVMSLINSLY